MGTGLQGWQDTARQPSEKSLQAQTFTKSVLTQFPKALKLPNFVCTTSTTLSYWSPITKLDGQELGVRNISQQLEQFACVINTSLQPTPCPPWRAEDSDVWQQWQQGPAALAQMQAPRGVGRGQILQRDILTDASFPLGSKLIPTFPQKALPERSFPPGRRSITQPPQNRHCMY